MFLSFCDVQVLDFTSEDVTGGWRKKEKPDEMKE